MNSSTPDDFTKQLMIAHSIRIFSRDKQEIEKGFNAAVEAFTLKPSLASARELNAYSQYAELKDRIGKVFSTYTQKLLENRRSLRKKHGHQDRLLAGMLSAAYLRKMAREESDLDGAQHYRKQFDSFEADSNELM